MTRKARIVMDAKAALGEGPCWDYVNNRLLWVDILGKRIHIFNPKNQHNNILEFDQLVGALAMTESGDLVLALQNGLYFYSLKNDMLTLINNPEIHLPDNRFNDGKCDPAGRFWAGTMGLEGANKKGNLYCLNSDLTVKKVLSELTISNGMAWSPNNQKMYFIDTPTKQIVVFDFDFDSGSIRNKKVAVTIPDGEGVPDGMTIDEEGMVWVAHFGGAKVSRWNPVKGVCLEEIHVPADNVTSCVFGGEQLDELYITTARSGLSEKGLKAQPLAGGLFSVKVGVKGVRSYRFKA